MVSAVRSNYCVSNPLSSVFIAQCLVSEIHVSIRAHMWQSGSSASEGKQDTPEAEVVSREPRQKC